MNELQVAMQLRHAASLLVGAADTIYALQEHKRALTRALDRLLADQGLEEDGEWTMESARDAEALLEGWAEPEVDWEPALSENVPSFDLPENCPKCGRDDVALGWFESHHITPRDLEVAMGKCCEVGKCPEGEHMHWSCRSCHYQLRLAPRSVGGTSDGE